MTDNFTIFKSAIQTHFHQMQQGVDKLYELDVDKDELWECYLDSFPEGTNPIFRVRREHDCSFCRQFIRQIGAVVTIDDDLNVHTIWELDGLPESYSVVAKALNDYLHERPIKDVFVARQSKFGTDVSHEQLEDQTIRTYDHFYLELPMRFVDHSRQSEGEIQNGARTSVEVFQRGLDEITDDAVDAVLELIDQNSLYKGEEWKKPLLEFKIYMVLYQIVVSEKRDLFCWKYGTVNSPVTRIRNTSIGTLLVDLSEGMELDEAVRKYECIVAPENYKRSKPIYTKRMLEQAQQTVTELGYLGSLGRRFATLDDITINNILFANRNATRRIAQPSNVFEEMAQSVSVDPKRFSKVAAITIDDLIRNILPTASSVELLLENRHLPNMVSLIAPQDASAPSMFKWDNPFSWAYTGNITDSSIRENVKMAGGKVDSCLRFSIQWNDEDYNPNDFDAHCYIPNPSGRYVEVYYRNPCDSYYTGAELDVDIQFPKQGKPAVENIVFPSKNRLTEGTYVFWVHNYRHRGGKSGFKVEIELDGEIFSFDYPHELKQDENVVVAELEYSKKDGFKLRDKLSSTTMQRTIWGLKTNQFIPVTTVMYSPNYWDGQIGSGNKHYFFMLEGCVNNECPNGFYNEYLKQELYQHRKVFEALGSKMAVQDVEDQLSGVGFSSTRHNSVTLRIKGATERVVKVMI